MVRGGKYQGLRIVFVVSGPAVVVAVDPVLVVFVVVVAAGWVTVVADVVSGHGSPVTGSIVISAVFADSLPHESHPERSVRANISNRGPGDTCSTRSKNC